MELFERLSQCELIENASSLVERLRPGIAIVTNQPAIVILPMCLTILTIENDGQIEDVERLDHCEAIIFFSATLAQVLGAFSRPEQRVWLDKPIIINPAPVERISFNQMRWLHNQLVTTARWVSETLVASTISRQPRPPVPQPNIPPPQTPQSQQATLPVKKRTRPSAESELTASGGTRSNSTALRSLLEPEVILCVKRERVTPRPPSDQN